MSKGNLFIISGPSGAGKGTICKILSESDDIYLSVSVTTRNKRNDETDGVTYIYDTTENFLERIKNGKMLEWAQYQGNFYGTPKDIVEEKLASGINVILEIEVQGALKVKEQMPEAVMIFVIPPSIEELRKRLIGRGREDEREINRRIAVASSELLKSPLYSHVIINDNLAHSTEIIRRIIDERKERLSLIDSLLNEINQ